MKSSLPGAINIANRLFTNYLVLEPANCWILDGKRIVEANNALIVQGSPGEGCVIASQRRIRPALANAQPQRVDSLPRMPTP